MKRKFLATSVASLLAASSISAVELMPEGYGSTLIFPVVTEHAGYSTLLSLAPYSRDDREPAVTLLRLALRSGESGERVAALNVYLDANSTWTGAVNNGVLSWNAGSCVEVEGSDEPGFGPGSIDLGGSFQGFAEAISMARLDSPWPSYEAHAAARDAADTDGSCAGLADLVQVDVEAEEADPSRARSRLRGAAHLIDVASGLGFNAPPSALDIVRLKGFYHAPYEAQPTLADSQDITSFVRLPNRHRQGDPVEVQEFIWNPAFDAQLTAPAALDAVSAALMSTRLEGEFFIDPALGAATDLFLTFPTRHLHLQQDGPYAPRPFDQTLTYEPAAETGQALVLRFWHRDGRPVYGDPDVICMLPPPAPYSYHVLEGSQAHLQLGADPVVDSPGAVVARNTSWACTASDAISGVPFVDDLHDLASEGQWTLEFHQPTAISTSPRMEDEATGSALAGLPVIVTALTRIVNDNSTPGIRANYGFNPPVAREVEIIDN